MSYINNNNNNKVCLNPLADTQQSHHSGMTHTDNGLRAASHVSMENTIHAHEYQPTCPCADCQALLHNFTQYEILDAYTAHHLRFEASIRAAYGYVPAIGSACTYVVKPVCVGRDERTGAEIVEQQVEYTNSYLFHMHLHHMKPVPAEVRERSYQRFFDNNNTATAPVVVTATNNNNVNHQQQQHTMMAVPAPRNFKQNGGGLSHAFATHQNVYQPNKNNNNNNNVRRQNNNNNNQQQQSFYNDYSSNNFQNYYAAANNNQFQYTASDVEQAKQSVAFSGIATLGN